MLSSKKVTVKLFSHSCTSYFASWSLFRSLWPAKNFLRWSYNDTKSQKCGKCSKVYISTVFTPTLFLVIRASIAFFEQLTTFWEHFLRVQHLHHILQQPVCEFLPDGTLSAFITACTSQIAALSIFVFIFNTYFRN